jgi:hypothetical protein
LTSFKTTDIVNIWTTLIARKGNRPMGSFLITALIAGLIINLADIAITLLFAAKPWNAVLIGQGIEPSPFTPPYYIIANFVGAGFLLAAYQIAAVSLGKGSATAFVTSLSLWAVTRLYGGGHAVMRQIPWWLFAIMSSGLGLGYILAGQFLSYWLQ